MKIRELLKEKAYINLDIEGGYNPQKGFLTMHHEMISGVDLVWDYRRIPYPFPDRSMDLVRADRVLEKVPRENGEFIRFMDEIWRILKYDEKFMIATPYANAYQYYQDPLNVNPLNEAVFSYFDPLEEIAGKLLYKRYKPKPWKIEHITFQVNGLMEVLLSKRREDKGYGQT
jgi:SAM-dependent methyltransferase